MPSATVVPRWPAEPRRRRDAAAPALPAGRERARRRAVQLVFVIFVLAMAEGALRKWVAPQLGTYIFFLRDPVLLLLYVHATRHGLWPRGSVLLRISVSMAAGGVLLFALQAGTGGESSQRLLLGVYGWRAYFLYVPMACLIGEVFRRDDVLRLVRLMLWLSVPIAVLVAGQFAAAPGAPINVGIAEDKEFQFQGITVNAERTRPTGTFASAAGQQQYVAAAFALLLAMFISPRALPQLRLPVLLGGAGGLLTCVALSGSRGMVLQCGLSVVVALAMGVVARHGALRGRALVWPAVIVVAAVAAYPLVFPEGYETFVGRWQGAAYAESRSFGDSGVFGRALYGLVDFFALFDVVPLFGFGLGYGGNAAITLRASIDGMAIGGLAENDFSRHMVDLGPLVGLGYVVFRLALAAWLTRGAFRATRRLADPLPLMLWSYASYVLVMGQLTGQGTVNFFGWLATGLLIAASRLPPPAPRRARAARPTRTLTGVNA